jgi:hypothetical protein
MSDFLQSTSGRLLTLAVSVALLGGGAAAVVGGTAAYVLLSAGLLGAIVCAILSVAMGIERFSFEVALSLVLLPWALFLYAIGQQVVAQQRPEGGYFLIALGIAAAARAAVVKGTLAATQHIEAHAH